MLGGNDIKPECENLLLQSGIFGKEGMACTNRREIFERFFAALVNLANNACLYICRFPWHQRRVNLWPYLIKTPPIPYFSRLQRFPYLWESQTCTLFSLLITISIFARSRAVWSIIVSIFTLCVLGVSKV